MPVNAPDAIVPSDADACGTAGSIAVAHEILCRRSHADKIPGIRQRTYYAVVLSCSRIVGKSDVQHPVRLGFSFPMVLLLLFRTICFFLQPAGFLPDQFRILIWRDRADLIRSNTYARKTEAAAGQKRTHPELRIV